MTSKLLDTIKFYIHSLKTPVVPAIDCKNKKRVVPFTKNYQHTTLEESIKDLQTGVFEKPNVKGAVAILKPNYIVIDVDVKGNIDGKQSLNDMSGYYDFDFIENSAIIVESANGGLHLYYKLPEKYKDKNLRQALRSFLNVEFLRHKITMPASKLYNGKTYEFRKKTTDFKELPSKLLGDLLIQTTSNELLDTTSITHDHKIDIQKFKSILSKQQPISEGGRSNELYSLACLAKEHGLSQQSTTKILTQFNSKKILPPLDLTELTTIISNAYSYCQSKTPTKSITAIFPELTTNCDQLKETQTEDDWRTKLYETDKGVSTNKFVNRNLKLFLENLPEFKGRLGFDENIRREVWTKPLNWHSKTTGHNKVKDDDILLIKDFLTETEAFDPYNSHIYDAVRTVAIKNSFHPIKDYFNSLPEWDKVKRLHRFFPDYCGSEDNEYTQELAELIFTAVVTRVFEPGCDFQYMPVLVGEGQRGKSLFAKYLAIKPEWHTDKVPNLHSEEFLTDILGKLIVESAELKLFKKHTDEDIKVFISRTTDEQRIKFERKRTEIPRQFIIIGNSNYVTFLRDPSGSRRFLPIEIIGGFRGEQHEDIRPLLYAEAIHNYKNKRPLRLLNPQARQILIQVQENSYDHDPLAPKVDEWLVGKDSVTVLDIWEKCLGGVFSSITKKDQIRITGILRKLNWKRTTKRLDGQVTAVYKKQ